MIPLLDRCSAIADNRKEGATRLAGEVCDILIEALATGNLDVVVEPLRRAKPMMAPVLNAVETALTHAGDARAAIERFREGLLSAPARAGEACRDFVAREAGRPIRVVTLSASEVVERAVVALHRSGLLTDVVVAESMPMAEGVAMAGRLHAVTGRALVVRDFAVFDFLTPGGSMVLIGADAVLPDAVVNKTGSAPLCLAARVASRFGPVPAVVTTTSHKILQPGAVRHFRMPSGRLLPPADPEQAPVWDADFEAVPRSLLTAIVTEEQAILAQESIV